MAFFSHRFHFLLKGRQEEKAEPEEYSIKAYVEQEYYLVKFVHHGPVMAIR